jgi:hypothetical protein
MLDAVSPTTVAELKRVRAEGQAADVGAGSPYYGRMVLAAVWGADIAGCSTRGLRSRLRGSRSSAQLAQDGRMRAHVEGLDRP